MQPLSFLALGDSYTVGENIPLQETFSYQLVRMLRQAGYAVSAPEILATTGWTTGELLDAMTGYSFLPAYDLVTLCIGVNNQYRGLPARDYETDLHVLFAKAIALAGGATRNIFVFSIPDYSVTPFARTLDGPGISLAVDQFNAVMRNVCDKYAVRYTDVTTGSRAAVNEPDLLAGDGLHPSGKAYQLWAQALLPILQLELSGGRKPIP